MIIANPIYGDIWILRFDFKAVVKKKNGEVNKVPIELQKAKQAFEVMRFRRYVSEEIRDMMDVEDE